MSVESIESEIITLAQLLLEIDKDQNSKSHQKIVEKTQLILQTLTTQEVNLADSMIEIFFSLNIPSLLINVGKMEHETKKDIATILRSVIRKQLDLATEYFVKNAALLETLLESYCRDINIYIPCGEILRECIRSEPLADIVLKSKTFFKLFDYLELPNFDAASDAFYTFKECLTRHKTLAAEFLIQNYDQFCSEYIRLLRSENYVTKRQSIKLIGELISERKNYYFMMKYLKDKNNFKIIKRLLCNSGGSIQFEAYHVFKVFLANPKKVIIRNFNSKMQPKLDSNQ